MTNELNILPETQLEITNNIIKNIDEARSFHSAFRKIAKNDKYNVSSTKLSFNKKFNVTENCFEPDTIYAELDFGSSGRTSVDFAFSIRKSFNVIYESDVHNINIRFCPASGKKGFKKVADGEYKYYEKYQNLDNKSIMSFLMFCLNDLG